MSYAANVISREDLDRFNSMSPQEQEKICLVVIQACQNRGNVLHQKWGEQRLEHSSIIGFEALQAGSELLTWQEKLLVVQEQMQATAGQ